MSTSTAGNGADEAASGENGQGKLVRAFLKKPPGMLFEEWTMHLPNYVVLGTSKRGTPEEIRANILNTFTNPPPDVEVRDLGYLKGTKKVKNGQKTKSEDAAYNVVGVNVFRCTKDLGNIASKVESLREHMKNNPCKTPSKSGLPDFIILTWKFKSFFHHQHTCVVHLFQRNVDFVEENTAKPGFERALQRFLKGDDNEKKKRLKFVFEIHEAAKSLKRAVNMLGGERPVIIGKALHCQYFQGENYLEIDQDVGSSKIASMLNSTILKGAGSIIASTSWVIEAHDEDELPERLLASVRWHYVHINDVCLDLDENYQAVTDKNHT
mmetsp:Transcript_10002/g.16379  ORF Transcript_10002/g.16379 Transcript_10002/m.16379 type:complete len:324 (+) Transcript_10002:621-1592(+)|eukprot:CAMPEP_0203774644 /NCGR_PEP_ID=MMETSP0099_2-20121227/5490_1 /ASSEMBLY_ACC=CAM_ASM_000209 /TAXON_ID=96639 /ORGANISM=" , Strain NY0313808BC1" /LENGTH=323 /DNA_ID=CAMNT_0050672933 /DNA_START=2270 /DNA_END=3241 /DNA_ORIENTATION=-